MREVKHRNPAKMKQREDVIIVLLLEGEEQRTIAEIVDVSETTIQADLRRMRERCGARSMFELGWKLRGERIQEKAN